MSYLWRWTCESLRKLMNIKMEPDGSYTRITLGFKIDEMDFHAVDKRVEIKCDPFTAKTINEFFEILDKFDHNGEKLQKHKLCAEHVVKPYVCPYCGESFDSKKPVSIMAKIKEIIRDLF